MREHKSYYMHLSIDVKGDNPENAIKKLDEKIEELINNEGETLASEGYSIDIEWAWSEYTNI